MVESHERVDVFPREGTSEFWSRSAGRGGSIEFFHLLPHRSIPKGNHFDGAHVLTIGPWQRRGLHPLSASLFRLSQVICDICLVKCKLWARATWDCEMQQAVGAGSTLKNPTRLFVVFANISLSSRFPIYFHRLTFTSLRVTEGPLKLLSSPVEAAWLIDSVCLEMVSWLIASELHSSSPSLTPDITWWVSPAQVQPLGACVCANEWESEWFTVDGRLNLNAPAHTKGAYPDFSHWGACRGFHSFFTRVSFATPESAVMYFLNLTGQLE